MKPRKPKSAGLTKAEKAQLERDVAELHAEAHRWLEQQLGRKLSGGQKCNAIGSVRSAERLNGGTELPAEKFAENATGLFH